jgi:hypothetical protein
MILRTALVDRSALVRRIAADLLIEHRGAIGADAVEFADRLACDPSPSVSERGRFLLSKLASPA